MPDKDGFPTVEEVLTAWQSDYCHQDDFCDPAEEEAAVSLSQQKLYRARGLCGVLESPHVNYSRVKLDISNPVPVYGSDNDLIGYGVVRLDGNRLVAEIAIRYDTAERLILETKSEPLYLHVSGCLGFEPNDGQWYDLLDFVGSKSHANLLEVNGLELSRQRPADSRILDLSEPLL